MHNFPQKICRTLSTPHQIRCLPPTRTDQSSSAQKDHTVSLKAVLSHYMYEKSHLPVDKITADQRGGLANWGTVVQGATVISYTTRGIERLFASSESKIHGPGAIRGGVPICWSVPRMSVINNFRQPNLYLPSLNQTHIGPYLVHLRKIKPNFRN